MSERDGGARYTLADIVDQSLLIARDKTTLLHAAELLEEHAEVIRDARSVAAVHRRPYHDDLLATAKALREMAG